MGAVNFDWWLKSTKDVVGPEVAAFIKTVSDKNARQAPEVKAYDKGARKMCALIYSVFFSTLPICLLLDYGVKLGINWGSAITESHGYQLGLSVFLSFVALQIGVKTYCIYKVGGYIAAINTWMHYQMHWKFGGSKFMNFVLDHFFCVLLSLTQASYVMGHRLHHQRDNDWSPDGRTKDFQSTFIFSKNFQPVSIFLWVPYFMFIFRLVIAPFLTFKLGTTQDKISHILETVTIAAFHFVLFKISSSFYFSMYLPSLFWGWIILTVALYEQHDVPADTYFLHPTNNVLDPNYNAFSNLGYHLEHHLFPQVHPFYVPRVHGMLNFSPNQIIQDDYEKAGYRKMLGQKNSTKLG